MSDSFRVTRITPLLHSHVFDVERRLVEHDGSTFERDVVTHTGAVAILAMNDDDEVGLLRQYRAPFDAEVLEIPAGTLDVRGEQPLDAAKRELREELGCEAADWRLLGRFKVSPGWTNQVMNIFEARALTLIPRQPEGPEERASVIEWVPVRDLKRTLAREDTLDYTLSVALHRVFGTFFDED
ncbi:MAG: NUDIX hydrolase [Acidimicrobiales bacterium]